MRMLMNKRSDRGNCFPIAGAQQCSPDDWLSVCWQRSHNRDSSSAAVCETIATSQPGDASLSGDGKPEQFPARKVSWTFWNVLGARPMLGRVFTEDEDIKIVNVVVISYGLWQRRFGGASDNRLRLIRQIYLRSCLGHVLQSVTLWRIAPSRVTTLPNWANWNEVFCSSCGAADQ
jgi:hypothetical protein